MRVLITGSSGFLGKHLLKKIPGDKVTLGRGESDIVVDLQRGIPDLSGRFDIVVHAAGKAKCNGYEKSSHRS
jgi:nucleoside-diphosphate-sugar epimerase